MSNSEVKMSKVLRNVLRFIGSIGWIVDHMIGHHWRSPIFYIRKNFFFRESHQSTNDLMFILRSVHARYISNGIKSNHLACAYPMVD